jgi:hypothetical protein
MPDCPNCGLATQRTKDWVCQWCGYPLVSNSYKVIDKTYKELQDERKASASPYAAKQPEFVPEYKPEPKREPLERPVSQQRPAPAPYPRPQPSVDSDIEPESVLLNPAPPGPEAAAKPEPVTPPPTKPKEETLPVFMTPVQPQPEMETPPVFVTPPPSQSSPMQQSPPQIAVTPELTPLNTPGTPKNPLPPTSKPEFNMEPEPEPLPQELMLEPEDIENGMEIAVEQIDMLFKTQQEAAHEAFIGKTFIIQGIVEKIFIREHLDIRYILLTGVLKGITWSLRCTFEQENGKALTGLQEGQAVKLRGTYDSIGKNIIFKNCALV